MADFLSSQAICARINMHKAHHLDGVAFCLTCQHQAAIKTVVEIIQRCSIGQCSSRSLLTSAKKQANRDHSSVE